MNLKSNAKKGPVRKRRAEPEIEWREYPCITPGEYPAYCEWGKIYLDPGFRSWKCLLRWVVLRDDLTAEIATLPQWFALGNGEKPRGSRRGNFLKEMGQGQRRAPGARGSSFASCVHTKNGASGSWRH
jgi:hypothetical protein